VTGAGTPPFGAAVARDPDEDADGPDGPVSRRGSNCAQTSSCWRACEGAFDLDTVGAKGSSSSSAVAAATAGETAQASGVGGAADGIGTSGIGSGAGMWSGGDVCRSSGHSRRRGAIDRRQLADLVCVHSRSLDLRI
jgi:hypothetical protein